MSIVAFVSKVLGTSPKLALFIMILGALILCTIRPSFEGYTSYSTDTEYDATTFDDPSPNPEGSVPTGTLDTGLTSSSDDTLSSTPPPQPQGITYDQIPPGEGDLYILKSQVVPPVCPACPAPCPKGKKSADECPACPPCARCPEPSYDCKLVPNYDSANNEPIPLLNDFSQF